jgi:hypothetical protein
MTRERLLLFIAGVLVGIGLSCVLVTPALAQFIRWSKRDVTPIILVRPGIGGFVPVQGSSIGNIWRKDDVVPMCQVKPSMGGFVPVEGTSIGNTWEKEKVRPFILVKPDLGEFVPSSD